MATFAKLLDHCLIGHLLEGFDHLPDKVHGIDEVLHLQWDHKAQVVHRQDVVLDIPPTEGLWKELVYQDVFFSHGHFEPDQASVRRDDLVEGKGRQTMGILLLEFDAEFFNALEIVEAVRLLQLFCVWKVVLQLEDFSLSNILHTHQAINRLKRKLDFLQIILGIQNFFRQKLHYLV